MQAKANLPKAAPCKEVCESSEYAWQSAAALCADMARDIVANLTPDSEWRIDVPDEIGKALFSFRIVAETPT